MNNNLPALISEVSHALKSESMQQSFVRLLPKSVKPDRFTEVTIAAIHASPEVLDADRNSLYQACIAAAKRGLLPDKKEGALVIFNSNVGTRDQPRWMKLVQFMPMVEGIIKEMGKAGVNAYAVSVYENDTVSFWNDDAGQHVYHEPVVFGERGKMVGVFAAAMMADGRNYVEPMSLSDIGQVARRSKQCSVDQKTGELKYGGTWRTDFDRMSQKSALHRLRKRLPIADEDSLQNLKDMEEEADIDLGAAPEPADISAPAGKIDPSPTPPEQAPAAAEEPRPKAARGRISRPTRRPSVLEGIVGADNKQPAPTSATAQPEQSDAVDKNRGRVPEDYDSRPTSQGPGSHSQATQELPEDYEEGDII
jgi:recombination protein RecT